MTSFLLFDKFESMVSEGIAYSTDIWYVVPGTQIIVSKPGVLVCTHVEDRSLERSLEREKTRHRAAPS